MTTGQAAGGHALFVLQTPYRLLPCYRSGNGKVYSSTAAGSDSNAVRSDHHLIFYDASGAPGSQFTGERNLPPEVMANIEAKYHLNDPILTQYGNYLLQLAHGDFGPSFKYKDYSVNDLVANSFPVSAKLGLAAFLLAVVVGVAAGVMAALKQNTKWDYLAMGFAMTGVVIPSFVVAPLLVLIFAITLKWLPGGGWNGGEPKFIILPMVALSLAYIACIARITRGSMIEVLHSNFIRTARAKGLPMRRIIFSHTLKPALLLVISYMAPAFAGIILPARW